MIGISEAWRLVAISLNIATMWLIFFSKRKLIKHNKELIKDQYDLINMQEKMIALLKENSGSLNTQLKQCEKILKKQHQSITHCHQFTVAFIASTKKEMQEKDIMIQRLRKVKNKKYNT